MPSLTGNAAYDVGALIGFRREIAVLDTLLEEDEASFLKAIATHPDDALARMVVPVPSGSINLHRLVVIRSDYDATSRKSTITMVATNPVEHVRHGQG